MRLRSRPALIRLSILALAFVACAPDVEPFAPRARVRGSFGEEVYKAVCRRVAGTEYPQDVAGERSEALCLGDAATVQNALTVERPSANPRLLALAERRAAIAQAIDDMMPGEVSDELENLFRLLVPFYDPPDERMQNATRELAGVIEQLLADPNALEGLARVGREGMLAPEGSLGMLRGTLGASHLRDVGRVLLPLLLDAQKPTKPHYETLLNGLALELATSTLDADSREDARQLKQLALRSHADFASGKPLYGVLRDARGLPLPTRSSAEAVPYPFVDANGDGLADAEGSRLSKRAEFTGAIPEPFSVLREANVARDELGRARAFAPDGSVDATRPLYQTADADATLLAGLLRAGKKILGNEQLASDLSRVLPAIVGAHAPTTERYGAYDFAYSAPDAAKSSLLDLVHGSAALLDRDVFEASAALTKRVIEQDEAAFVEAFEPLLTIERRTRPGQDAYPSAQLKPGHTLWDELLYEVEKVSRRRNDPSGETLLAAMMRATLGFGRNNDKPDRPIEQIVDPEILRHQGLVVASLMRFKDEWRANPKGESKRTPDEAVVLGSFRVPVDRTLPDSPVTCGSDGCGGLIAGTAFERWRQPGQQCILQRPRRSSEGRDCGAPANQSLLQRSMGLIAEMAGRSQCNKPITIGDLLDFAVLKPPCGGPDQPALDTPECNVLTRAARDDRNQSISEAETAVARDYACPRDENGQLFKNPDGSFRDPCAAYADKYPATFVDRDGLNTGAPATIESCHMLDLPDVGRTFGAAVTHEYTLQFPNPWVHRYLDDVARADGSLPECPAPPLSAEPPATWPAGAAWPPTNWPVVDPRLAPGCTPSAAKLSRQLYENDPEQAARLVGVNELWELVQFLLDDSSLFGADAQDRRDLRPDVKALGRVLFAPAGSSSFLVFDPQLIRGAPPACAERAGLPECSPDDSQPEPAGGCCIKDLADPPLRYRLDTYYGATSFAWEQSIKLGDGRAISFLDTMKAISDAVARYDYQAGRDDPAQFEDLGYVFSSIGKVVAQHYDSDKNPLAQNRDPNKPHYRHLTGIVTYEPLLADMLDDASADRSQLANDGKPLFAPEQTYTKEQQLGVMYHSLPLLQAFDRAELGDGRDGIRVSADVTEQLISGHARCAGSDKDRRVIAGEGACDKALRNEPGYQAPFAYRDGRKYECWADGRCFDGAAQPLPRHFTAPLYVMLDALGTIDDTASATPEGDRALRAVISGVLDTYLATADGRLLDRNFRALLLGLIDFSRERVAEERAAGTVATFPARSEQDMADLLHNPVIGGGLGLFESLASEPAALSALSRFASSSLNESAEQNNLRPLLAGLFDLVQLLPGDDQTNAGLRALAGAFSKNVHAVIAGQGAALSPHDGAVGRNVSILRSTAELDTGNVMERVLQNAARVPPGRPAPLEVILEALLAINRKDPSERATPSAEDLRLTLQRVASVMRDDRRGFERLYQILRCSRSALPAPGCD